MERFEQLIEALVSSRITAEQRRELAQLLENPAIGEKLQQRMYEDLLERKYALEENDPLYEKVRQRIQAGVKKNIQAQTPVRRIGWYKWVAAAAVLILAAGTWFFIKPAKEPPLLTQEQRFKNDVDPGKAGAKLKLSDGRTIELSGRKDGFLAKEGGYEIHLQNGEIVYTGEATKGAETIYNELIADKKERSSAQLPDGSIAWVNASSSVRYPVNFTGQERKVTMTGEAIFKVTHNEKQPFRVYVGDQVFEDVGTEFNINAYGDESAIRTTVLEGLVKVGQTMIRPGQQASVVSNGKVQLQNVDTDQVFAWRDGQFEFSDMGIEEIMKQAARWYDVDVVYEGRVNAQFSLSVNRDKPISQLLKKMELSGGVHFEIEGRKITVKP